jgi:formylglycine-generating enzyme required for sulfatase activity
MPFTLETWKDQFARQLPGWKTRLERAATSSAYYFIAATAFLPIVQAASAGDWSALVTLGAALGSSVGANLLANLVQQAKDRPEAEVAEFLENQAKAQPDLQPAIATLLEKLDALALAQQALPAADRAWFAASLQGDGALAQGNGAIAVGKGAVNAGGDISGPVNTGTVNFFFANYQTPTGAPRLSQPDFERILKEYLDWVIKAYGRARLYGLESTRVTREQPRRQLADVFVPLSLRRFSAPRRSEIENIAADLKGDPLAAQRAYLKAIENHRGDGAPIPLRELFTLRDRLAIIGSAGSGKSTLAAYLAASLAQSALNGTPPEFDLLAGRQQLLPLLIPLRYLREYQDLSHDAHQERLRKPRTGTLAGFIPWYLSGRSPALELSEDFFDRLLLGQSCLLILDGLDEVVDREERAQVRAQVEALVNNVYPGNLILVTARESGYLQDAVFGEDFTRLDVQPLNDKQIAVLVSNWCRQLYPEAVKTQTGEILSAIQDINRRYQEQNLPPLISTPLMTTMVVSVKWGENELPRERAKLYEAAVKVILQAQYLENDDSQHTLVNWGGPWDDQRRWLSYLALAMQQGGRDGVAIPETRLRAILATTPGLQENPLKLETFLQAIRLRGGLFEERGELFQFAHLTFQEFLAARWLAKEREGGLNTLAPLAPDPWWREVCLLLYGFARDDYAPFATYYLDWLGTLTPQENHLVGLELACQSVLEIEKPDPVLRQIQAERLCRELESAGWETTAATRTRCGDRLAALGDPRFDPQYWFLPRDATLGFVHIPTGKFWMGEKNSRYDAEKPEHEVTLPDFWLARYPVTVAQFRAFSSTSGYSKFNPDALHDPETRPVRYVTWYDALAYCAWLQEQLLSVYPAQLARSREGSPEHAFWQGLADGKLGIGLPSEAEWEKAARGPDEARIYPWGNNFDPSRANTEPTGIGTTSAMGCFLGGASPYGLLDMSGNVWEWTRSLWGYNYPYDPQDKKRENLKAARDKYRVLRGGAFLHNSDYARCAYREGNYPGNNFFNFGFRIVCSPFFSH